MEGRIQALLVVALLTLLRPSLAEEQLTPQLVSIHGSSIDLQKCWSSLFGVESCVIKIYKSVVTGKFENIGAACCKAFKEVDAKCWPQMFPLNPLFPPLLKDGCSRISASSPSSQTKPQRPLIPDLTKCLSSLVKVQGCVTEIYKSIFTGKFGNVGPMCCNAFLAMDAKCWPQMFPSNPFFPPLLKKECSRINTSATAPTQVMK